MGVLEWLGLRSEATTSSGAEARGVVSPWAGPATLQRIVVADLWPDAPLTVTRAEAMTIPAVVKARHLICTTLARQPLKAYKDGVELEDQPTWLYRTDTGVPPRMRILWTLDDMMFGGWSLWGTNRGAEGQILDAARVPTDRWKFDSDGRVLVDDKSVSNEQVLLLPGPFEGLLGTAASTIRGAKNLEIQWAARVRNPVPVTEIRYTGEEDLEVGEMRDIRDTYISARGDDNGTVMVTPRGFEVHAHGDQALNLFVEGRNAVSVDVARFTNVPATMLDASNVNASSVSYSNEQLGRSEFADLSLRSWAMPLEERLSMDDCVPRGTYVAFDLSNLATADTGTGPVLED